METFERICLCALQNTFGYEPQIPIALIERLGSAEAIFSLGPEEKRQVFGPFNQHADRICRKALDEAEHILQTLPPDCRFIGWGESGYPPLLADCPDAPAGLYYRSETPPEEVFAREAVAVVGTRKCSSYGHDTCEALVRALCSCNHPPLILSGLALGIDGIAHRTALSCGTPTVGVMATGIDDIYPTQHEGMALQMVRTPGCALITDYPPGTAPLAPNFLRRNRLIAGIARATVLAESRIKGGGMMTARLAASYDREVYAIPGNIDCPPSQGCNLLLREKVAEAVTDMQAFVDALGYAPARMTTARDIECAVREHFLKERTVEEAGLLGRIAALVRRRRDLTAEELAPAMSLPYGRSAALLGQLESAGFARSDLQGRYRIITK